MDGKLNVFEAINRRVGWLSQRQRVLAENIAHADTPDYRPQDLRPFAEHLARTGGPTLNTATTHAGHIQPVSAGTARRAGSDDFKDVYETSPTGNEVILEQQLIRVSETAMQHQVACTASMSA